MLTYGALIWYIPIYIFLFFVGNGQDFRDVEGEFVS